VVSVDERSPIVDVCGLLGDVDGGLFDVLRLSCLLLGPTNTIEYNKSK